MRHFPVAHGLPVGWMTAQELHEWRVKYDASDIVPGSIDMGGHTWRQCLSSDLRRAYETARAAHTGEIMQLPLLREIEFNPFRTGRLRLPIKVWHWMLRLAWLSSHESQRVARDDFRQRVQAVADLLDAGESDTLVVSHAGMMIYLRKELVRRGFQGPPFRLPDNARLYLFERPGRQGDKAF